MQDLPSPADLKSLRYVDWPPSALGHKPIAPRNKSSGSIQAGMSEASYLRFAAAVMSTDSFAMKLAPHQLDPGAGNGLIGVVAIPVAV